MTKKTIESAWWDTMQRIGIKDTSLAQYWLDRICEAYGEPHRTYHNRNHIEYMLNILDEMDLYMPVLILAIIFHDVIYDVQDPVMNESRSAVYAQMVLNDLMPDQAPKESSIPQQVLLSPPLADRVADLVLTTQAHHGGKDYGAIVLNDIDLAILGAEPEVHKEYALNIRIEYQHVPNDVFREARARILLKFVAQDRIYFTDYMFKKYEFQARKNIAAELDELLQPSS